MMYADIGFAGARREEERGSDAGARQFDVDLTCLVNRKCLGELTGNDRTLSGAEFGRCLGTSGHNLSVRAIRS